MTDITTSEKTGLAKGVSRMLVIDSSVRLPPIRKPSAPAAKTFLDAEKMPVLYKMTVDGDCLHPLVTDGMMLAFDRGVKPAALDLVAVFLTPEAMGTFWWHQIIVKRLVKPFPRGTRLGAQVAAAGRNRAPRLIVEQLNPFRQYAFRPDQVLGIHACVGRTEFKSHDWHQASAEYELTGGRRHG